MSRTWFANGLQFACTQCGHCCTGEPGFVWVNEAEVQAIADRLGEPLAHVEGLYTRMEGSRRTLRERANGDCVFFTREQGCTIYDIRPRQCRTWPFWESNVRTPADWDRTAAGCPGCNQGELITEEEILQRVQVIRI
jgi:Fe-S-cluster containining protein